MRQITTEQFGKFCSDYFRGKYPNLRLGQAFLSEFYQDIDDQDLFYHGDNNGAINIIVSKYVKNPEKDAQRLAELYDDLSHAQDELDNAQSNVNHIEKLIAKIEDSTVNSSGVCEYNTGCGWSNAICGNTLPCHEHDDLICSVEGCNRKATGGCDNAGSLVCGAPVCKDHHQCGRHGW